MGYGYKLGVIRIYYITCVCIRTCTRDSILNPLSSIEKIIFALAKKNEGNRFFSKNPKKGIIVEDA